MLGTDFQLKTESRGSQLFVLTKIAWKQGKQGQNTNIVFDQTAGTGNLKPFVWGDTTVQRLYQDCKQAQKKPGAGLLR